MKKLLLEIVAFGVVVLGFALGCAGQSAGRASVTLPDGGSLRLLSVPEVEYPAEAATSMFNGGVWANVKVAPSGIVLEVANVTAVNGPVCLSPWRPDTAAIRKAVTDAAMKATFAPVNVAPPQEWVMTNLLFNFENASAEAAKTKLPNVSNADNAKSEPKMEMRVDRITKLGTTDSPTSGDPKMAAGGVLNGKATTLAKPNYPAAARAVHAGGSVNVQVLIDTDGTVVTSTTVSGHPLLKRVAELAACDSRFSPTFLAGQPVKVSGLITYNFVP